MDSVHLFYLPNAMKFLLKPVTIALIIFSNLFFLNCARKTDNKLVLREGDLIFQKSLQAEHLVMNCITPGYFNHCGIILKKYGNYVVLSAEKTVKITPLKQWIAKGENNRFAIYRPPKDLQKYTGKIIAQAMRLKGRIYDYKFSWDDEKIYSAELIYQAYKRGADIYPGKITYVTEIYENSIDSTALLRCRQFIPYNKEVITPTAIIESGYFNFLIAKR